MALFATLLRAFALYPLLAGCRPGRGGSTCQACALGSFSAGGTVAVPRPSCTVCPTGYTTTMTGSNSSLACSGA